MGADNEGTLIRHPAEDGPEIVPATSSGLGPTMAGEPCFRAFACTALGRG